MFTARYGLNLYTRFTLAVPYEVSVNSLCSISTVLLDLITKALYNPNFACLRVQAPRETQAQHNLATICAGNVHTKTIIMNSSQNLFYLLHAVNMCSSWRYDTCSLHPPVCWQYTQHWSTVSCQSYTLFVSDQTLSGFKYKSKLTPTGIMGKFGFRCD
jgi:hypothetical protein